MVSANPAILYIGIPLYFLAGTVWAIVKWYLYVKRSAVKYKEERREFLLLNNIKDATLDTVVPESLRKTWSLRGSRHRTSVPQVGRNKGRILTWMTLWPFSVVWAIIDEPWRYIYDAVASMLQRISNAVYRRAGYDSDMSVPGEEPDGASGVQD